jgi:hypothetical protein
MISTQIASTLLSNIARLCRTFQGLENNRALQSRKRASSVPTVAE